MNEETKDPYTGYDVLVIPAPPGGVLQPVKPKDGPKPEPAGFYRGARIKPKSVT